VKPKHRRGNGRTQTERRLADSIEQDLIAEVNLSNVLAARAESNKFYLFTCDELARALHLSIDAIYAVKRAGAPFPFGKSRPEWVLEFLKTASGGSLSIKTSRD